MVSPCAMAIGGVRRQAVLPGGAPRWFSRGDQSRALGPALYGEFNVEWPELIGRTFAGAGHQRFKTWAMNRMLPS
jgi:hypothetical protein